MSTAIHWDISQKLNSLIRVIPDFPKPGILFRDITPLLADPAGLALAIQAMTAPFQDQRIDVVVGAESRGFIFGTAIARELHAGFVPVRKPGKLPAATIAQEYTLEYGTDTLEIHADAITPGQRVLLVDDLLATGGTMQACCQLVTKLGGQIAGTAFLIELAFLNGRHLLGNTPVHCLLSYPEE